MRYGISKGQAGGWENTGLYRGNRLIWEGCITQPENYSYTWMHVIYEWGGELWYKLPLTFTGPAPPQFCWTLLVWKLVGVLNRGLFNRRVTCTDFTSPTAVDCSIESNPPGQWLLAMSNPISKQTWQKCCNKGKQKRDRPTWYNKRTRLINQRKKNMG